MRKFYLLLLVLINGCIGSMAQQKQGANWFFGGIGGFGIPGNQQTPGNHLDFNTKANIADPFLYDFNNNGGVATISDKNGNLLFFSSLGNVATRQKINNKFQRMPNGDLFKSFVNGTTSELIVQNPIDPQEYYIFIITGPYPNAYHDFYYAKVDMRLNNGYGDVMANSLQLLKKSTAAGMAAMLHANNQDAWLLMYNVDGDSLRSYLINAAGLQAPVITITNKNLSPNCRMKSSPNSEMFVATNNQDEVEVFRFNRATGAIAPLYTLTVPNAAGRKPAAFAFSPDNTKLFVGSDGIPSPIPQGTPYITQFNLAAGNNQQIQQSATSVFYKQNAGPLGSDQYVIRDMQLAIDGKIYIARIGPDTIRYLSRINYPDQAGVNCGFEKDAIRLHSYTSALPALNQTIFRNAGILQALAYRDTICLGDSVQLSAFGAGMERFRWQPANGLTTPSDTLANPVVRPTQTTTYLVIGSNPHQTKTATVTVTVLPKPTTAIVGSPSVCPQVQGVWYKALNPQKQQISWGVKGGSMATVSNDSISVNWGNASSSALVWAVPKNKLGCPGDTSFFPVNINVILATETPTGADTLCLAQAENVSYRIGSTTGSVYNWGIQGGSIVSGQGTATVKVSWNQPGLGKLWVQEESQTSTSVCRGLSDTLRVLIQPSPAALTLTGPQQVFTLAENQEYRVLNPEPGHNFNWAVTGGTINSGQGSSRVSVNWGEAGTGIVEVYEMNGFGCPGEKAALQVHVSGSPQPKFYNIITPNHDGLNDAFVIENLKWYPENELQIFNRWGTEVYRSSNYQNNWSAENVSSGVYYYYFRANGQSWKGWVEVVR